MTRDKKQIAVYARIGLIVGQVNRIEMEVNNIIVEHYMRHVEDNSLKDAFSADLLFSGIITLDNKLKLFNSICKIHNYPMTEDVKADFNTWKITRNTVAHGIPGTEPQGGSVVIFYQGVNHDIDKLFKGFGLRQDRIMEFINKLKVSFVKQT